MSLGFKRLNCGNIKRTYSSFMNFVKYHFLLSSL